MDIEEALKWTDDRVFAKTGKHLDSLQMAILEGVWQRETYEKIGDDRHCSKHHVRKEASELWQILSNVLEENVKKSNVKSILENGAFYYISNVQIGDKNNFCSEQCPYPKAGKKRSISNPDKVKTEKRHDLTEVPKRDRLYNRIQEINTLKQWILEEKNPIVTIIGLSGIGKTALAVELVTQIKDNFDRLLWRNCSNAPSLESLKTDLIQFLSPQTETKSASLIDCLRSHRCLIILDDFQELFTSGELAGNYRPDCQDYSKFLKQIATTPHQSCLLILSWEKPIEIATLEGIKSPCRTLKIDGLGESAKEILTEMELTDEDRWLELIQLYNGNPLWLNIAANTIQELFDGSVADFLSGESVFLGDLEIILQEHYQRLSQIEKQALCWLARQETAGDISAHPPDLPLSESDFLKAVQSLLKRGLIEKVKGNGRSRFTLQPAIQQYVKNQF
ncbi:NB-ARC domain-containing protein [Planktothricoides raciborskii]|uniref:NACHT domain-containing protein n=1 Tax=Planktothricoides raciborskii FACHB-1370 TaxID=2949576 RepID=A0ABR8EJL8_9CYAN|nr:NB-ARC domain-containing protein [Planktothricoides raciborskii]MBD2546831.1 NACHT domain-containing protein [Planktothricoides raciborskii FACHB-1370]MBD2585303.1 NACHT domain-containing protein [Planktothricoides raciborskii FACHB-1261]